MPLANKCQVKWGDVARTLSGDYRLPPESYHRQQARRSEHATADALDVSGFRLADGDALASCRAGGRLRALAGAVDSSCHYFGNAGAGVQRGSRQPFHFGMRGQGFCS